MVGWILGRMKKKKKKKKERKHFWSLFGRTRMFSHRTHQIGEKMEEITPCQPNTRFTPPFSVYLTMHIFYALSYIHTSHCTVPVWIQMIVEFAFLFYIFLFLFLFSPQWLTSQLWIVHPCTVHGSHKLHFSVTFSLKMGLTALFTHLKIISLQCFHFQFSVSAKISSIQTDPVFFFFFQRLAFLFFYY